LRRCECGNQTGTIGIIGATDAELRLTDSISHTIAAVLLVPIATRIGESLEEPHPRLLIMVSLCPRPEGEDGTGLGEGQSLTDDQATALICSAGMGLPVSGFPNMTAITQENKLGHRFIGASDFLKNGIPASVLATFVS
jgi:phosphate transporter